MVMVPEYRLRIQYPSPVLVVAMETHAPWGYAAQAVAGTEHLAGLEAADPKRGVHERTPEVFTKPLLEGGEHQLCAPPSPWNDDTAGLWAGGVAYSEVAVGARAR